MKTRQKNIIALLPLPECVNSSPTPLFSTLEQNVDSKSQKEIVINQFSFGSRFLRECSVSQRNTIHPPAFILAGHTMLQEEIFFFLSESCVMRACVISDQNDENEKRDTNRLFVLLKPLLWRQHNQVEVIFINSLCDISGRILWIKKETFVLTAYITCCAYKEIYWKESEKESFPQLSSWKQQMWGVFNYKKYCCKNWMWLQYDYCEWKKKRLYNVSVNFLHFLMKSIWVIYQQRIFRVCVIVLRNKDHWTCARTKKGASKTILKFLYIFKWKWHQDIRSNLCQ